ncbi:MAG: hypothetical protein K2Q26_00320 [Bdellovibrionales bacterium]|nr:hypothetical protein [Bdellovibrionales bacterium]
MKFSTKILCAIMASSWTAVAFAQPSYFVGQQKITLQQTQKCFIEVTYGTNAKQASVRGILLIPHDNKNVAVGPLTMNYKTISGKESLYFEDKSSGAPTKQAILWGSGTTPVRFQVAVLDGNHYDNLSCDTLQAPTAENLEEVEEAFEHFEEIGGGNGHNHKH